MKINIRLSVLIGILITFFIFSSCKKASDQKRPNIIFILADDHAAHALSCYGSDINNTPNIDRLAREGMRFTNCFVANSLSAPSRATLISGKHSNSNGFKLNGEQFDNSQVTFPMLLQNAGYQTALFGKWHLVSEPIGFDYYAVLPSQGSYYDFKLKVKGQKWKDGNKGGVEQQGYFTSTITDKAIRWIKNRRNDKPFCLMLHHKAPHTPHRYPEQYRKLYKEDLPLPQTYNDDFAGKNDSLLYGHCGWSKLENMIPAHILKGIPDSISYGTEEYKYWAYQEFFKGYLRLVASLDENVGYLFDFLEKSDIHDNTLIVYTSDNGFLLGDHGLFNKMWMYDPSMRIPLLVRYPKEIEAGTVNNQLVSILDLGPTFLDYANTSLPKEFHGKSIRSLLKNSETERWRSSLYYHYYGQYAVPAHYGIRTEREKLMHFYKADRGIQWELYDLEKDPNELNNLFNASGYRNKYMEMKENLRELMDKYNEGKFE